MYGSSARRRHGIVRDELHLDRQHVLRRRLFGKFVANRLNVSHGHSCGTS